MPHFLVCNLKTANETYYPLKPGKNTIGRARDNDIVLLHGSLSRHHAEIVAIYYSDNKSTTPVMEDDACITIRDRQSLNGTYINHTKVQNGKINVGDVITLGKINFKLINATHDLAAQAIPGSSVLDMSYRNSETQ
ncbi:MAG: FHA domain-containing protein [Jaaginema sp. PMC 1079.18]|nr:FHA domain-containing protein [Jaaginema sp. PMC 1080.18]MEC4850470.1 FHA domain-containing protein [Jaaginema sp. PMC 1079.18]MEC4866579.1 FHA domain-containing protein [Jaaginema sp. PMC 1078.18]